MAPYWQPGVQYNYDDVVQFEGRTSLSFLPLDLIAMIQDMSTGSSNLIAPSDWTPDVTPALWGRLQASQRREEKQWGEDCKPCPPAPTYGQTQRVETDQPSHQAPPAQPEPEQKEKHWYDIDEKQKKELEIGGGILAGLATVGAGVYAYKQYEHKKEEKQAHAWTLDKWIAESQARTQQWRSGRYDSPVAWIWCEGKNIPRDAIQGGEEHGETLYICRAYHETGMMVGKASRVFKKGAVIGFKKDEIHIDKYEILVGDSRAVKWVNCAGKFKSKAFVLDPLKVGGSQMVHPSTSPRPPTTALSTQARPVKCTETVVSFPTMTPRRK
ncbi:carbohydrate-binding module family 12 protein [Boletus reticuloceps]|uniref:Carbohydrate-binding module family 12 protein n=1 Tax=Boletus reticuloceps TaxID=495285 RepID=A0A8I3A9R2_9AGAM|nr:carbohydrate-binding module family 12 protein [Boletus reticuloceps]